MTAKKGSTKVKVGTGKASKKEEPKVTSACPDCAVVGGKSTFKHPKPGMIDEHTACPTCSGSGVVVS